MLAAQVLTISINRNAKDLYEQFWRPDTFSSWAKGLAEAKLEKDNAGWYFKDLDSNLVRIAFTGRNDFLVMDHTVYLGQGKADVFVPMRIVPNGKGSEVSLTLFRQPDMDDETFEADARAVRKDLVTLKELAERS